MIDLEAIRARVDSCRDFLKANPILASGYMLALGRDMGAEFSAIFADADALLAEVEQLRRIVLIDACQREADKKFHDGRVQAIIDGIKE